VHALIVHEDNIRTDTGLKSHCLQYTHMRNVFIQWIMPKHSKEKTEQPSSLQASAHPMCVYMLTSSVHFFAKPKSQSLMTAGLLSSSSVLSSLRSRCATQCRWQYSTAQMNCCGGTSTHSVFFSAVLCCVSKAWQKQMEHHIGFTSNSNATAKGTKRETANIRPLPAASLGRRRAEAHPEEVPGLVLAEEEAAVLRALPLLGDIGCQAPARRVLHHQRQVLFHAGHTASARRLAESGADAGRQAGSREQRARALQSTWSVSMASFALMTFTCPSPRSACICARRVGAPVRMRSLPCSDSQNIPTNRMFSASVNAVPRSARATPAHARKQARVSEVPELRGSAAGTWMGQEPATSEALLGRPPRAHPYLAQDVWRHDARDWPPDELDSHKLAGACACAAP